MVKIIAHNGVEVLDFTPEAEIRFSAMEYIEERQKRELERQRKPIYKFMHKVACACGIM